MHGAEELAQSLVEAHAANARFETLHIAGQRLSVAQAYEVQDSFVARMRSASGDEVVGYKIGLTSRAMQEMCGIDTPVHGRILASRVHASGCALDLGAFGRLGLEFEIAVRLGLELDDGAVTVDGLAAYVDAVCPAIELVDDRRADYATMDAASLIADNSWNAGIVLGAWARPPQDLSQRAARLLVDGVEVDHARVGDAGSHPFAPVCWLARELAQRGSKLPAGTVVMTGSVVKTRFPEGPGRWVYEVDGFDSVAVEVQHQDSMRRPTP